MDRNLRSSREQAQVKHPCPGRKGPAVFEWQDIDGFLIRTYIDRSVVSDVWGSYNDHTRKFNAFDNEWDLCSEFAKLQDQRPDDDDDDDDDDNSDFVPTLAPVPVIAADSLTINVPTINTTILAPPLESAELQISDSCYQQELEAFLRLTTLSEPAVVDNRNNLDAMLEYRYGMQTGIPYNRSAVSGLPSKKMTVLKACMILLDTNMPISSKHDSVVDFVNSMDSRGQYLKADRNPNKQEVAYAPFEVPFQLFDLHERNPNYLSRFRSPNVTAVTMVDSRGVKYYKLLPIVSAPTENWHVIVTSAMTAVESLRRGWKTQREIVTAFIERGTAFYTGIPSIGNSDSPPIPKPQVCWRSSNFKATPSDYAEYEIIRDALLREPRGRSALMTGGIIWRLAKDVLDSDTVLSGPSCQVSQGTHLEFPREGMVVYDDMFSALEHDMICGVYAIYTGA
jgi:hypothetical protein